MSPSDGPQHQFLRASAGTGKTYQLVEAYVRLVEKDKLRPSQIAVITFTRKAAAELRLRIRKRLLDLGAAAPLLAELGRAPLGNFHGLALQLMSSFGLEAGLTGPLRVLAEAHEDSALFAEACQDVWFAGDAAAAAAVGHLAPYLRVGDTLPMALWEAIALAREDDTPVSQGLLKSTCAPAQLSLVHAQMLQLRAEILQAGAALSGAAVALLAQFQAAKVPVCPAHAVHWPQDAAGIAALAEGLEVWRTAWLSMFAFLRRNTTIKKIYSAETQIWVNTRVAEVEADAVCACLSPALGVLLERAWDGYTRLKQERGVVDFVDIITRLNHLLESREDLRQGVRQRFAALLVDEAQDTNRLQRRMINLLCGFSHDTATTTDKPASVFVVGDWKQSIYTFRGADPQSFDDFARAIEQRGGLASTLSVSRRSAPQLVCGINSLGASLFGPRYEALQPLDSSQPPGAPEEPTAQHADVGAAVSAPLPAPGTYWLTLPAEEASGTSKTVRPDPAHEAHSLALFIQQRLARGAVAGDFAILLSAMTTAPVFLAALQRLGIAALLGGGSGLYEQGEIRDHVALLAWLVDAGATLQAAICLRSPLFGLSDAALWSLFGPQGRQAHRLGALREGQWPEQIAPSSWFDSLSADDHAALTAAAEALPHLVQAAAHLGAGPLLEAIDARLDARAVYLGLDSGPQRVANLQQLWRFAHEHDAAYGASLPRFVAQQAQRIDAAFKEPLASVPAAGRTAVTISTVHQAKGLQYPIVVLPRLGAGGRQSSGAVRYDRREGIVFRPSRRGNTLKSSAWARAQTNNDAAEQDERRRLLYVAMTRAERELVFVGPPAANLSKANFGGLLKTWLEQGDATSALTCVPAPEQAAQNNAPAPAAVVLSMPSGAPPTHRIAPPHTNFRVTVTALAHAELGAASAAVADPDESGAASVASVPALATDPAAAEPHATTFKLTDADAPLSASAQGELAHAVLKEVGALSQFNSEMHFVAAMLRRFGYAETDARVVHVRDNTAAFLRSALGRHIAALPASARRCEMPFQILVPCGVYTATVHGQLDLAFWDASGLNLVDYKHARPGLDDSGYLRQLDAYAYAMAELCQLEGDIRCHLVYLRGNVPPVQHVVTQARRAALRERLFRLIDQWSGQTQTMPAAGHRVHRSAAGL